MDDAYTRTHAHTHTHTHTHTHAHTHTHTHTHTTHTHTHTQHTHINTRTHRPTIWRTDCPNLIARSQGGLALESWARKTSNCRRCRCGRARVHAVPSFLRSGRRAPESSLPPLRRPSPHERGRTAGHDGVHLLGRATAVPWRCAGHFLSTCSLIVEGVSKNDGAVQGL